MTLTLSYRPTRFAEVVGQGHVKAVLRGMVREGSTPPALIFGGSRGTGKTTSARILAAALNCPEASDGDACGRCPSCLSVQRTNSTSVLEVDAASNGGVEEVRQIRDMCQYAHAGQWRVVLLDEAHSMTANAFNALLKILEEPPPRTVFVLVTTEVDRILETVRSRSMLFEFRRISRSDTVARLRSIADAEHVKATDDLLEEIATRSKGGLRDAVMLLDQVRRTGVEDAPEFRDLFGIRDVSLELFRAALAKDHAAGSAIIGDTYRRTGDLSQVTTDLTYLVRDVQVVRCGGRPECGEAAEEDRRRLAEEVNDAQLVRAITVLWELRARQRSRDVDQRASTEMAFTLLSEALAPTRTAGAQRRADEVRRTEPQRERLSISQVRALVGA